LVNQLIAYGHTTNAIYYTMCFIDGLSDEIKLIVLVQRPRDMDTACSLTLLQEEVVEPPCKREYRKPDTGYLMN
jgi:hypothetical protein